MILTATGLGKISDLELGYFNQGNYIKGSFVQPHKLLALEGTISTEGELLGGYRIQP